MLRGGSLGAQLGGIVGIIPESRQPPETPRVGKIVSALLLGNVTASPAALERAAR